MRHPPFGRRLTAVGIVAALALPSLAVAQTAGVVRGTVRRASDASPIPSVHVSVRGTGIVTVTGANGEYRMAGIPIGEQVLVVRLIGFAPDSALIQVVSGSTITADVALTLRPIQLSEVVVQATSRVPERIVEAPAAVSIVQQGMLRATAETGQLPLALKALPGVDVVQGESGDFNVNARGMNNFANRRVLVLVDGRDVAIPVTGAPFQWGGMAVPLDESARVEFVRGASSALYGANAFSGVLNIRTAAPRETQGTRVTVSGAERSTFQGGVRHAGVIADGRLGYRVNAGARESHLWGRSRTAIDSLDLVREYAGAGPDTLVKVRELRPLNGQTLGTGNGLQGEAEPTRSRSGAARVDWYSRAGWVATAEAGTSRVENSVLTTGVGRIQRPVHNVTWARLNLGATGSTSWGGTAAMKLRCLTTIS